MTAGNEQWNSAVRWKKVMPITSVIFTISILNVPAVVTVEKGWNSADQWRKVMSATSVKCIIFTMFIFNNLPVFITRYSFFLLDKQLLVTLTQIDI